MKIGGVKIYRTTESRYKGEKLVRRPEVLLKNTKKQEGTGRAKIDAAM